MGDWGDRGTARHGVLASGIMLVVAALASYLPARRAMRADPLAVLRSE